MSTRTLRTCGTWAAAALFASLVGVAGARAATSPTDDASASLPAASLQTATTPTFATTTAPEEGLELIHVSVPDVTLQGVHYRPRSSGGWGRHMESESVSQIHMGFFDPEGDPGRQFLLGIRGGPLVDPHVQLGVGLDWAHMTDNVSTVSHQSPGPGGTTITVQQDLSRASTNLFPIMAFIQVSGDENMSVIPFFGAAGGYEVLNLSADDYTNNTSFDATYGGWGWQVWGGAGFPISGRTRINGEVFVNTAEPGRDVTDPDGITYRETVKQNGVGMRIGIAWGF